MKEWLGGRVRQPSTRQRSIRFLDGYLLVQQQSLLLLLLLLLFFFFQSFTLFSLSVFPLLERCCRHMDDRYSNSVASSLSVSLSLLFSSFFLTWCRARKRSICIYKYVKCAQSWLQQNCIALQLMLGGRAVSPNPHSSLVTVGYSPPLDTAPAVLNANERFHPHHTAAAASRSVVVSLHASSY